LRDGLRLLEVFGRGAPEEHASRDTSHGNRGVELRGHAEEAVFHRGGAGSLRNRDTRRRVVQGLNFVLEGIVGSLAPPVRNFTQRGNLGVYKAINGLIFPFSQPSCPERHDGIDFRTLCFYMDLEFIVNFCSVGARDPYTARSLHVFLGGFMRAQPRVSTWHLTRRSRPIISNELSVLHAAVVIAAVMAWPAAVPHRCPRLHSLSTLRRSLAPPGT
jgi:hypothetical protein